MAHPLSPAEAKAAVEAAIPDFVFESFNALIVENLRGKSAHFLHKDLCDALVAAGVAAGHADLTVDELYKRNWLNTHSIYAHYRAAGWKVDYDRPGYCETYQAHWTFTEDR